MPPESDVLEAIDKLAAASRRTRPYMALGLLAIIAGFVFFSIYSNKLRVKAEEQAEYRRLEAETWQRRAQSWRAQAESWRRLSDAANSSIERAERAGMAGNRQEMNESLREARAENQRLSIETAEAAGPPSLRDPAWSNVANDPSGNVYAIRRVDLGNTTSAPRSIWVRGDHQADQTIMHRYSITLWQVDCANRRPRPGRRTNYHADGSVDRRPLPSPRVPSSVIAALGAVACP